MRSGMDRESLDHAIHMAEKPQAHKRKSQPRLAHAFFSGRFSICLIGRLYVPSTSGRTFRRVLRKAARGDKMVVREGVCARISSANRNAYFGSVASSRLK